MAQGILQEDGTYCRKGVECKRHGDYNRAKVFRWGSMEATLAAERAHDLLATELGERFVQTSTQVSADAKHFNLEVRREFTRWGVRFHVGDIVQFNADGSNPQKLTIGATSVQAWQKLAAQPWFRNELELAALQGYRSYDSTTVEEGVSEAASYLLTKYHREQHGQRTYAILVAHNRRVQEMLTPLVKSYFLVGHL
jgi:hypothetical protein